MSQCKRWRADPAVRLALDLAGRTLMPERSNLPAVLEQLGCSARMTASAMATLQRAAAYPAAHARLQASLPMTLQSLCGWVDQGRLSPDRAAEEDQRHGRRSKTVR